MQGVVFDTAFNMQLKHLVKITYGLVKTFSRRRDIQCRAIGDISTVFLKNKKFYFESILSLAFLIVSKNLKVSL